MDFVLNTHNVKAKMDELNMTYAQLSRKLSDAGYSVSESAIKKWFMKKSPIQPDFKNMKGVAEVLNLSINSVVSQSVFQTEVPVKPIQIVGSVSCGIALTSNYDDTEDIYYPQDKWKENLYALRAYGDSMLPDISDGDIVICDPTADIINGDFVHYTLFNEIAVKIYFKDKNGVIKLTPLNKTPCFMTQNITPDDTELLENLTMAKVIDIVAKNLDAKRKQRLKFLGLN